MANVCKICRHAQKLEIERVIAGGQTFRRIASQFSISEAAVRRHVGKCIPLMLQELRAAQKKARAIIVEDEVTRVFTRLYKLLDACDEWLTDPDDSEKYSLGARASELTVIYDDLADVTSKGHPKRKSDQLSRLLARLEKNGKIEAFAVTSKHADPRDLIVRTAAEIKAHLELFGRLQGLFQRDRANESDREHEREMIAAVNAEIQRLLSAGWSETEARGIVLEAEPRAAQWLQ